MNESSRPLQRPKRIFSGEDSKILREAIKKAKNEKAGLAVEFLGWGCQELELVVRGLENRIAKLEDR